MKLMEYKIHMENLEGLADNIIKNEQISKEQTDLDIVKRYQGYAEESRLKINGYLIAVGAFAGEIARDELEEYVRDYMKQEKSEIVA